MDIDPLESVEAANEDEEDSKEAVAREKRKSRLNTWVAITVALLATFLGVCKVKDDNIVQAMQQAQADKIDNWNFYQARNIREEVLRATAAQLTAARTALPPTAPSTAHTEYDKQITAFMQKADEQKQKKQEPMDKAKQADDDYNRLNIHDDQFDLSDALIAIAISLLAMTSLTQKRWLYGIAMVPTLFGVLYGLAGLLGWHIHSDFFAKLLGT